MFSSTVSLRILISVLSTGHVWFVYVSVSDLLAGTTISVLCIICFTGFSAVRSALGGANSAQFGSGSKAATEMEPGWGWFICGVLMIKAKGTCLHSCLELRGSLPCQLVHLTASSPGALKRDLLLYFYLSLSLYYCH